MIMSGVFYSIADFTYQAVTNIDNRPCNVWISRSKSKESTQSQNDQNISNPRSSSQNPISISIARFVHL